MDRNNRNEMTLGAMLVDLENLYLAVRNEYEDPDNLTMLLLQKLSAHIEDEMRIAMVLRRAYAPLDYSSSKIFINDLAMMGIKPVHVMARAHKNSADLMLAIDCMEVLFRREDVETFIIVGGDRDYIPVAERIRENARRVIVASPRHAMSGDLLTIIGEANYLDPMKLLPKELRMAASWKKVVSQSQGREPAAQARAGQPAVSRPPVQAPAAVETATASAAPAHGRQEPQVHVPASMDEVEKLVGDSSMMEDLQSCMRQILKYRRDLGVQEVWLGPFLRTLNDLFPMKNNAERKALLSRLTSLGAINIVQRSRDIEGGYYSVIIVNWSHPLVLEVNPAT